MKRHHLIALGAALLLASALFYAWTARRGTSASDAEARLAEEALGTGSSGGALSLDAGPASASADLDAGLHVPGEVRAAVRLSAPTVRVDPSAAIGTVRGRVVALGNGHGIGDATLTFEHQGRSTSLTSRSDGSFTLAPDELGTYVLAVAGADGFLPFAPEWGQSPIRFEVRAAVHVDGVVITLVDAIEYEVRVTIGSGAGPPAAGASVWVHGADSGERTLAPLAARHTTDARGRALVVAPDSSVLEAQHPEHGVGRAAIDSAAQVTRQVRIALSQSASETLRGDQTLSGHVLGAEGEPLEGARVVARYEGRPGSDDYWLHPALHAETNADGRFTLARADEGTYMLHAEHDEHAPATLGGIASDATDVVLRLDGSARLRVRVVDERSGAAIAAATVVVERRTGAMTRERVALVSGYDASATYDVAGVPAGTLEVSAAAPGYAMSESVSVEARVGVRAELTIRMRPGGSVHGRVTSSDGAPLAGARATLESGMGEGASAAPIDVSAVTDEAGRFELHGITPGTRSLVVWARDHHGRVRSGIVVTEGSAIDVGVIDLSPVEEGERPQIELAGIGAVLSARDDVLVIGAVVPGGGAAEAGLVSGDMIVRIDGIGVAGLGFGGCIERLRGPEGRTVVLVVRREGAAELDVVTVTRRRIRA